MNRSALFLLGALVVPMVACGGAEIGFEDEEAVGETQQELTAPPRKMLAPYVGEGMSGVGTPSCSGSETSSWGNSYQGGYVYVSCTYWYMAEWGPGSYTDSAGSCFQGKCSVDEWDSSWAH